MKRPAEPRAREEEFVRRPTPDNPKILLSFCRRCKKQIAGAPTRLQLRGAEQAHECQR